MVWRRVVVIWEALRECDDQVFVAWPGEQVVERVLIQWHIDLSMKDIISFTYTGSGQSPSFSVQKYKVLFVRSIYDVY